MPQQRRLLLAICAILISITWIVYWQVYDFEFVNLDDRLYVVENPYIYGLSFENAVWAFTTGASANWHPLTWLSLMLDAQLFGRRPGPMHLTNAVLHTLNVLVLFGALRSLTGNTWRSAFVAALFAVHPLHVESVAWVSERKDVLSTLFGFLAIWSYAFYARDTSRQWHLATLVLLTLSLLAKQMFVTLPFVFLLLDYWPLERYRNLPPLEAWRSLVAEKIPMLAVVVIFSLVALFVQGQGGAVKGLEEFSPAVRVENAIVSCVLYLEKTFWPRNLAAFYPHPGSSISPWHVAGATFLIGAVTVLAFRRARQHPCFIVGWLWYLGTLVPVIGLVQIGNQQMADRYTYLPLVGVFMAIAWWLPAVVPSKGRVGSLVCFLAIGGIVVLISVAWKQTGRWHDSERLYSQAIAATGPNSFAEDNLGNVYFEKGRAADAIRHFQRALQIDPRNASALNHLGKMAQNVGRLQEALEYFEHALEVDPRSGDTRNNLGRLLFELKRTDEAVAHYRAALEINPLDVEAHINLGIILREIKNPGEALEHFRTAARINRQSALARNGVGVAMNDLGRHEDALASFREAVRLDPKLAAAHANLAIALHERGDLAEALAHFQNALELDPANDVVRENLAAEYVNVSLMLDEGRNRSEALRCVEEALRLIPDFEPALQQVRRLKAE